MKTKTKLKYHFLLLGIIALPLPAVAETQTLEQVLALSYQRDPGLAAERAKLRALDEQVSQALGYWRPSIDTTSEIGKRKESIAENNLFPNSGTTTPRDESLNITQPVFRGYRTIGAVRSAKATVKAGQATLEDAEQKLLLDSAKAYLDVLEGQETVQINRDNETDLQKQLDITKDRSHIDLGKTDISQAESRLKLATIQRLQAENDLSAKQTAFMRLTGEAPGNLVWPTLVLEDPKNMQDAISLAEKNSPSVVAANYTEEAAKEDVTVAEGSLLPEVNIIGSAENSQDQDPAVPIKENSLTVMAQMKLPLYDAGSDYSKTRAAKQTRTQRHLEFVDARNKAREAVINAWQTLTTSHQIIDEAKEAVEATGKALSGVKAEAKVGTSTTLDILNAQQELRGAKISLVKAKHDEALALLQMKAAIGTMTAIALRLPVEIYNPKENYDKARSKWIGLGTGE